MLQGSRLKCIFLKEEDRKTKAYLALQCFKINKENREGNIYHPDIYKALYRGSKALEKNSDFNKQKMHNGAVQDLLCTTDGKGVYSVGSDGKIKYYKIEDWNTIRFPSISKEKELGLPTRDILNTISIAEEGLLLAAGKNSFYLYKDNNRILSKDVDPMLYCEITKSGEYIVSSHPDQTLRVIPVEELQAVGKKKMESREVVIKHSSPIKQFCLLKDKIYCAGADGKIVVYKLDGTKEEHQLKFNASVTALSCRKNLTYDLLIVGLENGTVHFMDVFSSPTRQRPLKVYFDIHHSMISDIDINFKTVAIASMDGRVSIWDLEGVWRPGYQPLLLEDSQSWVTSVVLSEDARYLFAGGRYGEVTFWNLSPKDYASFICEHGALDGYKMNWNDWALYFGKNVKQLDACE